jgi:hypothetical protein
VGELRPDWIRRLYQTPRQKEKTQLFDQVKINQGGLETKQVLTEQFEQGNTLVSQEVLKCYVQFSIWTIHL